MVEASRLKPYSLYGHANGRMRQISAAHFPAGLTRKVHAFGRHGKSACIQKVRDALAGVHGVAQMPREKLDILGVAVDFEEAFRDVLREFLVMVLQQIEERAVQPRT